MKVLITTIICVKRKTADKNNRNIFSQSKKRAMCIEDQYNNVFVSTAENNKFGSLLYGRNDDANFVNSSFLTENDSAFDGD